MECKRTIKPGDKFRGYHPNREGAAAEDTYVILHAVEPDLRLCNCGCQDNQYSVRFSDGVEDQRYVDRYTERAS